MSLAPPPDPTYATPQVEPAPEVWHTSVSNEPAEAAVGPEIEAPASEGADGNVDAPRADVEAVELSHTESLAGISVPSGEGLRDIAVASFGEPPALAETVHGPDDRVQIADTAAYPWRANASLLIVARDNSTWIGTGWFIGRRTLVTAGHCVYIKNSGVPGRDGWVKSIDVMPGRNGDVLPYGSVKSTSFRSVTGWTANGDQSYDYGAILIPTDLGSQTGWFGYGVYGDQDLSSVVANVSGYPGDKPFGTQWYDRHAVAAVDAHKVYYDIDTMGGQSGAAVLRIKDGKRVAIAVHAYGGGVTNSGTRIVRSIYDNLTAWNA
jgi:V8-like Glu-specific endopeptidase